MDDSERTYTSRLLLRLVQAVADSKYPARKTGRSGDATGTARNSPVQARTNPLPDAAWQRLEDIRTRFDAELQYADSCLAENPPSARVQLLLANSSELRKVAVLQRFIERAYAFRLDRPEEGLQVADDLISWTKGDPSPLVAAFRGRAWMERGNFLRILGDAAGAYKALEEAAREIEANETADPLEIARHQELLGTLERDCGNFKAAADLLNKAVAKVRRWGDSASLQRVLIAASLAELYNNEFEQAHALLDESLKTTEPDSLLLLFSAVNKLLVTLFSGHPHQAYQSLLRLRSGLGSSWMRDFPEANLASASWTEGQILNTLRIDDDAIPLLKRAREFFIRSARGYEVCHISIELATTYAAQRKFADVRRELNFGLPFCSSKRPLDDYAREAVLFLQGALEHRGRLQADQIRAVASRLDLIHRAPLQASRPPAFTDRQS